MHFLKRYFRSIRLTATSSHCHHAQYRINAIYYFSDHVFMVKQIIKKCAKSKSAIPLAPETDCTNANTTFLTHMDGGIPPHAQRYSITLLAHSHYLNITINLMKFHQQTRKPDFLCHRAKQECYVPLKRSLSHNGQSPDRKSTYG